MSEILKKLDDIIEITHEILSILELCEKESEVSVNGRYESIIGRNGKATEAD